MLASKYDRNN